MTEFVEFIEGCVEEASDPVFGVKQKTSLHTVEITMTSGPNLQRFKLVPITVLDKQSSANRYHAQNVMEIMLCLCAASSRH